MKPLTHSLSAASAEHTARLEKARAVCKRIAPLWPLKHFVAVNPFLGLADRSFAHACALFDRVAEGGMLMPATFFQSKWITSEITSADLGVALKNIPESLPPTWQKTASQFTTETLVQWIEAGGASAPSQPVFTIAEIAQETNDKPWVAIVVEEIARFCAAYYDAGQSIWRMPWSDAPLYQAWRAVTELDAGSELLGLHGFRSFVKGLPNDLESSLQVSLAKIGVPEPLLADYLHRQLLSIRGWAGHVQYRVREKEMVGLEDDSLLHLLGIRLAYDAALIHLIESRGGRIPWERLEALEPTDESAEPDLVAHLLWHLAFEHALQRHLVGNLLAPKESKASPVKPAVQAVFCIDVRSEMFRRSLEAASDDVETMGFAGFFGLPIEYLSLNQSKGAAQCPVLLLPQYKVRETLQHAGPEARARLLESHQVGKRLSHSWNAFKTSAISCFSFVETAGIAYGPKLFQDAFLPSSAADRAKTDDLGPDLTPAADLSCGIALEARIQLALGALRNMGLTQNFARLVLLCGHGSTTTNNPFGSGLDCGACGGHTGEANARVGAAILNDPEVRQALEKQNISIPEDTWFLAGLHNTTTDDVTLYNLADAPSSHRGDIAKLQSTLAKAAAGNRQKRSPLLGLSGIAPQKIDAAVRERSRDWAQVRPEWGLAGNAAFIVAPRSRTRHLDLGGRAFLHNYNHQADPDNSTLTLIMSAPMVVTNWINLQYYGSTVNNPLFGSGNKVLHNVVGTFGVCLGNGGDLQPGLPLQSVHDGTKWVHEPHRLNVFIEAPQERIEQVIAQVESVRQLVDNAWLNLFAIAPGGNQIHRYLPGLRWEAWATEPVAAKMVFAAG